MTKRVQDLKVGDVTTRGTISKIEKRGADVFRVEFAEGGFRSCAWGAVFTMGTKK